MFKQMDILILILYENASNQRKNGLVHGTPHSKHLGTWLTCLVVSPSAPLLLRNCSVLADEGRARLQNTLTSDTDITLSIVPSPAQRAHAARRAARRPLDVLSKERGLS